MFNSDNSLSYCTHKAFKGTVVNRSLPSLHGGSLEITLTFLLRDPFIIVKGLHKI